MKKLSLILLALLAFAPMAWAQWTGSGTTESPYQINSESDWTLLCTNVNNGTDTYSGKFFKLMANITVTETTSGTPTKMVGTNDSKSFQGTFDGNGHTITISYNDTRDGDFCAPFRYINGATIKYLHVAGTIYKTKGKNAGGLVGKAVGDNTIDNCRSSVDIHFTKNGDVSSGGFIGELRESGSTTFNNCLFDGKLRGASAKKWGGFVGWVASGRTATFNNCLFNPEEIDIDTDGCKTFARKDGTVVVNNCYYTTSIKDTQGATDASSMNNEQLCAALGGGWETVVENSVEKVLPIMTVYTLTGAGTTDSPYLIASTDDWNKFAANVYLGHTYSGDTLKLTNNISVTRSVGSCVGNDNRAFNGVFDGDGHTLTVALSSDADWCAPFGSTYGATINNLATAGTINTSACFAGGVVGRNGTANLKMTNVTSSVTINSTHSGVARHGGLVGWAINATLTGCAFTGELLGTSSIQCGGLMGWKTNTTSSSVEFIDCVFAPAQVTVSTERSKTLVVNNGTVTFDNCYYTEALGTVQGELVHSITPGNYVTVAYDGNATAAYNVSGITRYDSGIIMLNDVHYASNGKTVSLNLGYTLPEGWEFNGYQISAGTLEGSQSPYTLTMPDDDVIVNAITNFNPWEGAGTEESPYLISNADQWNLLAEGVNGGETYSGVYFQLTTDISVTTMVGSDGHRFSGHFDGNSNTLTVNYNTNEPYTAPFRYIEDAEITNLRVAGDITTSKQFAAGFVANAQGNNTMTNCRSSVAINSTVSGDGTHGGFVATNTGGQFTMKGCAFDGSMLGSSTNNCGGFVGWNETNGSPEGIVKFENCFFVPTSITVTLEHTYARSRTNDGGHVQMYYSNCRTNIGDNQQFRAYSISAGEGVTVATTQSAVNTYAVSGITIYNVGMMYDGVLYARNTQEMSLNLSYTGTGTLSGYASSAGTLSGDNNPFTLTMGTADAVINAIINGGSSWSGGGSGTSGDPYIISNSDEWDEFADKVNSGVFGFSIAYYQLAADITGITVTTMVGTEGHKFKGHFDGNGKTLTLSYGTAQLPFNENYCAPFRYIENAEIHDLTVGGNIYTDHQFAAGIAGYALNDNIITNCRSSVTINSSVSGDGTHGGFVAECQNNVDYRTTVTFTGCAFDGKLLGSSTDNCGGFVGWEESNDWAAVKFTNCLFAPSEISVDSDGSATFSRGRYNNLSDYIIIENSYYIRSFGTMQGEMAYIMQPDNMTTEAKTIAGLTVYVRNTPVTDVAATGITPNTATISWTGSEGCSNYQVRYRVKPDNTLYSTDFEGGIPDGWTMFDNDSHSEHNWTHDDGTKKGMAHSGKGCMYSASYINDYGALEPDNWLVSPQVALSGTMKVWLKGQDADEYREHFAIYLSTAGNSKSDFLDASGNLLSTVDTLVPETETTNQYQEYIADLSAYNGQGYIAIRHFNCQDEFYLVVDDFGLYDDNAGDAWTTVSDASPAGTTLEGLTADTTYEYQVVFQYGGKTFNTSTATLATLAEDVAPTNLRAITITANTSTINWTGYGDSYNLRYSQGGQAEVTLYVPNDIWQDGSGYQMLLDKDHNTYGSVIPETGGLTTSGDASPETYANFEYKIPEGADGSLNTTNVVNGTTVTEVTIDIPAGIYDWCITNPSPGDRVWIASEKGNVGGRQDDFVFEAGKHYTFTVTLDADGSNDCVNMTVEDDATLVPGDMTNVTGITSTSYTMSSLTATTGYTVYVQSVKGNKASEWSSLYFSTLGIGKLYVAGYGDSNDGWVFIASPVVADILPDSVSGLVAANARDYDLYRLNNTTWENYKATTSENHSDFTTLVNGHGYLYATKEETTLIFSGDFNTDATKTISGLEAGYHLVGNPFTVNATINKSYYTLDGIGSIIVATPVSGTTAIAPCTGVIVQSENASGSVTFTAVQQRSAANNNNNGNLHIALSQVVEPVETPSRSQAGPSMGSGTLIDNAIVSFNEGSQLGKFYFGQQNANIYIPQGGQDYAIAFSEGQGEMPLNFKAKKDGTYTLTVTPQGVQMAHLHLIDNLTGADIDLLAAGPSTGSGSSYTFTAKTSDYASRFRLVFSVCGDADGDNAFAFINNGNIIVNGEGVLQIVDVMGRIVWVGDAMNRVSTSGMTAGVYILRLIDGEKVRVQKMVIE